MGEVIQSFNFSIIDDTYGCWNLIASPSKEVVKHEDFIIPSKLDEHATFLGAGALEESWSYKAKLFPIDEEVIGVHNESTLGVSF